MPMKTTLVSGAGAASSIPVRTCPTISEGRRLRTRPMRAVAQKRQPMPQPAWLEVQPGEDRGRPVAGLADARTPGLELRAVEVLDVRPRHVGQLSAAVPRALPRACGRYGPRAVTSWPAACPAGDTASRPRGRRR